MKIEFKVYDDRTGKVIARPKTRKEAQSIIKQDWKNRSIAMMRVK
jgi:hypothetical protein